MSGSDRLKVSTAIVRKLNPNCGFVLLDKLEQMDMRSLQEFGEGLKRKDSESMQRESALEMNASIIIEDGYVVGQEQTEEPKKKEWKAGAF